MEFEDYLPVMAEKLGGGDFMTEICNGFQLLSDPKTGLITLDSLRRNAAVLGLDSLSDSELQEMLREGDLDGDGALNQHEFCVMMIRLSPDFMQDAEQWLDWAISSYFNDESQKNKKQQQQQQNQEKKKDD